MKALLNRLINKEDVIGEVFFYRTMSEVRFYWISSYTYSGLEVRFKSIPFIAGGSKLKLSEIKNSDFSQSTMKFRDDISWAELRDMRIVTNPELRKFLKSKMEEGIKDLTTDFLSESGDYESLLFDIEKE